jgi:hypothetical protein
MANLALNEDRQIGLLLGRKDLAKRGWEKAVNLFGRGFHLQLLLPSFLFLFPCRHLSSEERMREGKGENGWSGLDNAHFHPNEFQRKLCKNVENWHKVANNVPYNHSYHFIDSFE